MTNATSYRLICNDIGIICKVRKLLPEEERKAFKRLVEQFLTIDKPISIFSFQETVVELLVIDAKTIAKTVKEQGVDWKEFVEAVYTDLAKVFSVWSLENVCLYANKLSFAFNDAEEAMKNFPSNSGNVAQAPKVYGKKYLEDLESYLKENVVGQDEAVEAVIRNLKLKVTGLKDNISLLFNGPSGRGKGHLAGLLGEQYSGKFWKVPCGSYGDSSKGSTLLGSPPGYISSQEDSLVKTKADKGNDWVILFDEVDKAHPKFFDLFLELLEDGIITDSKGIPCDFSNSIFLFAANEGYRDLRLGESKNVGFAPNSTQAVNFDNSKEEILSGLRKKLPDEFLGRIDDVLIFNSLSKKDIEQIVKLELSSIPVNQTPELIEFVVNNGFDERYGARQIRSFISKEISLPIAEVMLEGRFPKSDLYSTKIENNKVVVINTKIPRRRKRGTSKKSELKSITAVS